MFDVAIIGGGVCGCSLLYQLAANGVHAVLLEKENDLATGATKANSAIVHAGYDPAPGTIMARCNVRGNAIIHKLCEKLDIPFLPCGSLVVAFDAAQLATLEDLYARGVENGVPGLRLLDAAEARRAEPGLAKTAVGALLAPSAGVISPWELSLAQAEAAVQGGAKVLRDCEVTAISPIAGGLMLQTPRGPLAARFVVNAAGTGATDVAALLGAEPEYAMLPTRGEYFLLDKSQGALCSHVLFRCPGPEGKGVLVAPTVHGNLIVGPNAEELPAPSTATTAEGLSAVRAAAGGTLPGIDFAATIRNFAGVRAITTEEDFILRRDEKQPAFFHMAGIKSPGLTAAPALAEEMLGLLAQAGLALNPVEDFPPQRRVLRFNHLTHAQRADAVRQNPLYGNVVCRCETVTEGEIVDAARRPVPPRSLDAVKRRCGAGMGRCQGGFCGPKVQAILARELGASPDDIPQEGRGAWITHGMVKEVAPDEA